MVKKLIGFLIVGILVMGTGCNLMEKHQVEKMQKMAAKIDQLDGQLNQKEAEYRKILTQYGLKGDKQLTDEQWQMLSLTSEQRKMLQSRLNKEQDSSYKAVLQEVLDKDQEIKDLRTEIDTLREQLPKPVVVKEGDNHYDLSMRYLIDQKGVNTKDAQKLIERVNLLNYLVPGFEVWLFYDGGTFGTFVTQGTANQSPNQIKKYYKTKLINERNTAQQEASQLKDDVNELERRKAELTTQLAELEQAKVELSGQVQNLNSRNKRLSTQNTEKERRLNSVFYHVDNYKALAAKKVVGRFLFGRPQLKNFNAVTFEKSLDLRQSDSITLTAADAGVKQIHSIYVMPRSFVKDKDYKIDLAPDKSTAVIYIVNPGKFQMSKVLFAIR
ncbi:MAG: hypothetical protein GXO70_02330 [Acidobacteria bacterium]|nr:hypothetical protein [Acidobacteriota bacterium]